MNETHLFAERLIACERVTPALRDKYRREVTAMLEKPLGIAERAIWIFWTIFSLAQFVFFSYVAVWSYGKLPAWGTVIFGTGCVFALAFAGLSGWIAFSGRVLLKTQPPAMAGLGWGLVVVVVTVLMVAAPDSLAGLRAIVCGLVFLVGGAVFLLGSRIEQAELRNQEKLLEIECQLVDVGERLPKTGER